MKAPLPLLAAFLICMVGCGPTTHTLVGSWTFENPPSGVDFLVKFESGGQWSQTTTNPKGTMDASGSYSLDGASLTMNQTEGNEPMGALQAGRRNLTSKITWLTDDTFEMEDIQPPMVYRRKK